MALRQSGVVVAFHRVTDGLPEDDLTRGSRDFDRFCEFFRDNFDVISLDAFVSRLEKRESVGGALAITFDDGYLDNFEVAAPILKRYGLPATFFVTTRFIDSGAVPWWDRKLAQHPGWMKWDHVRTLAREGFEIGGHTRTHADLGLLDGPEAEAEICGSRQDLVEQLGRAPVHFAYPYGQPNNLLERNRQRVIAAGFRSCGSCHGGTVTSQTDPFRLWRVPISLWYRTPAQFGFGVAARTA